METNCLRYHLNGRNYEIWNKTSIFSQTGPSLGRFNEGWDDDIREQREITRKFTDKILKEKLDRRMCTGEYRKRCGLTSLSLYTVCLNALYWQTNYLRARRILPSVAMVSLSFFFLRTSVYHAVNVTFVTFMVWGGKFWNLIPSFGFYSGPVTVQIVCSAQSSQALARTAKISGELHMGWAWTPTVQYSMSSPSFDLFRRPEHWICLCTLFS